MAAPEHSVSLPSHLTQSGLSNSELLRFVAPVKQPVSMLDAKDAFAMLTAKERLYALRMARGSWLGALACLVEKSPEAAGIFALLQGLFAKEGAAEEVERLGGADVVQYAAAFYGNFGNYASFGDTKIVPRVSPEKFREIVASVDESLVARFDAVSEAIYSLDDSVRTIGFAPDGVNNYYSAGITREEAQAVQEVLTTHDVNVLNTRLSRGSAKGTYVLHVASAETDSAPSEEFSGKTADGTEITVKVLRGDLSPIMKAVAEEMIAAKEHAANDTQREMLDFYAEHFRTGAHEPYVNSQRRWVKDKGPSVETNIGFVETYVDPLGVRAEFEGLVAAVNRKTSEQFASLVAQAPPLLSELPWPSTMEKDVFLQPDFNALEVIAFGNCGVPAGINIPNLNCVRQDEGFKNVSLQNVLSSRVPDERTTFLGDGDQEIFNALQQKSFAVQVGLHELLGHGSGKHLMETSPGKFNFDREATVDPLTNAPVTSWYKPGESWESVFTDIAASYEECRAECVGVYLCTNKDVLEIFGHTDEKEASDIAYVNWLNMARAGLVALEQYNPGKKTWGQAHMQARFAILRTLLADGGGCVSVDVTGEGDDADVIVSLDRSRLEDAKAAVGKLLVKLQLFKSTADGKKGRELYDSLTAVPDDWIRYRDIVLAKKKPRRVFVQAHIEASAEGTDATYTDFEATPAGIIESFQKRFPPGTAEELLKGSDGFVNHGI